jgi:predicted transcriptional regulator
MNDLPQRHYVRLDNSTQNALDELCRHLYTTKSELMRRCVREGVRRETAEYAQYIEEVRRSERVLDST